MIWLILVPIMIVYLAFLLMAFTKSISSTVISLFNLSPNSYKYSIYFNELIGHVTESNDYLYLKNLENITNIDDLSKEDFFRYFEAVERLYRSIDETEIWATSEKHEVIEALKEESHQQLIRLLPRYKSYMDELLLHPYLVKLSEDIVERFYGEKDFEGEIIRQN